MKATKATRKVHPREPGDREERSDADPAAHEVAHADVAADLAPIVGRNLRRLRGHREWSLERLSKASGVSRAMLGQVELGQSAPTINVLWKVARALGVPFSALISTRDNAPTKVLRASQTKKLTSHDGSFSSRALFPYGEPRRVEFYELKIAPKAVENADAHPPGTTENLVVTQGKLEIETGRERYVLDVGDSILFEADTPHVYRNLDDREAVVYLVMAYAEEVG